MPKLKAISIAINVILLFIIAAMYSNTLHPFEDPAELMRAIKLGWAIRGLSQVVNVSEFQTKCIDGVNYDNCRESIGHVVNATRARYKLAPVAEIPHAMASAPMSMQRP